MILGILGMTVGLYHAMAKLRDMAPKRMGVLSLAIPSLCCGGHLQPGLLSGSLLAHKGKNSTCCNGKTWLLCVQAALCGWDGYHVGLRSHLLWSHSVDGGNVDKAPLSRLQWLPSRSLVS